MHKLLFDVYFFGAIAVPFFVSKGYGVSVALIFTAIYMVASMVMEVPTGIVGDRYGHRSSIIAGLLLVGFAFLGLLAMDNIVLDVFWTVLFATGAALTTGSDTALIRSTSNNFERDNRSFEYLKSVMLLLSFGAAGFVVKYLSIEIAVGLSALIVFCSIIPLLLMKITKSSNEQARKIIPIKQQISELPRALRKVKGGVLLIILAGMIGAITFSAKEVISSFNPVYDLDISLVGIIAALAMAGRIAGTAIEKRLNVGHKALLLSLVLSVGLTVYIDSSRAMGVVFMLLSTVIAQMLFYRLKYRLASEAPQSHVASLVSGLSLTSRLFSGGIILITSAFAAAGYFHLSFAGVSLILLVLGGVLVVRLDRV